MNITECRTETILKALHEKHNCQFANEYGEPGYTSEGKGILFANWNDVNQLTQAYLEGAGYELEWSDEWTICDNGKAWRTQPDRYYWQSSVKYCDGYILTTDDDPSEWIESEEMTDWNQPTGSVPSWITPEDLENAGFVRVGDAHGYESGLHPGQDDNPAEIAKVLFTHRDDVEAVVFRITSTSQFTLGFEAYVKTA